MIELIQQVPWRIIGCISLGYFISCAIQNRKRR